MPLDDKLATTLRAIQRLRARRQDDLEDYFHDAIVKALADGKTLEHWLGYLYKSVSRRIACGQEGRINLSLDEVAVPPEQPPNMDLAIDIQQAVATLTARQQEYIYDYFYKGKTEDEIAEEQHTTRQAVSRILQRGLKRMKGVLRG